MRGDYLYSAERTYISCLNLKTGEETKYDFLEIIQDFADQTMIEDIGYRLIESFTVTETDIWITAFGTILGRLNLETNEVSYSRICKDKDIEQPFYEIKELYTEGKELYVTCCSFEERRDKVAYFAHIQTDIVEKTLLTNTDVMILEILVE